MTKNPRMKAAHKQRKRYQGKDCPHGHGTERYTINGQCVVCVANAAKARRQRIKDALAGNIAVSA